jgi:ABC-2 type transport system permease protein
VIRAELLKIRTTRVFGLVLVAAVALVVAGASGLLARADVHDPASAVDAVKHVGLTSLFALVLGILAVAGEYRHRTISETYLTTPHRARVLVAKAGVYAMCGAVIGVLAALFTLMTSALWLAARHGSLDLSSGALWRTLGGGVAWDVGFAIIGVGLGAIVRNLAGAVTAALAWLAVVEGVIGQLVGGGLARWLPFAAGSALGNVRAGLPQAGAGLLLLAYAVVAVGLGAYALERDVT